jgi:hypothetical protein
MKQEQSGGVWYWLACAAVLVAAAAIRFRALDTTLFEDEVWVAQLVRNGGWAPHTQATPPLFYFLCRGWTSLRGVSDVTLREPAALLGVALCAVPLFAPLPRLARFIWLVLLAFSSPLVFYSSRLKQYTLEAFVAAVLLVLFLHWWKKRARAAMIALFVIAAIGVTGLHGTIIVLGAMAAVQLTVCSWQWTGNQSAVGSRQSAGDRGGAAAPHQPPTANCQLLLGLGVIFALWAVAYRGWIRPGAASTVLHGDMDAFFAMHGRWVDSPRVLLDGTLHWMGQALNLVHFWWLVVPLAVAVWVVLEREVVVPVLAILPPVAVAAASALHVYPYGEVRLMVFVFPGLYLLVAAAIGGLAQRTPLLLVLTMPFVWSGVVRDPYNSTYMQLADLRQVFAMVARARGTVYADPSFAAPLRYYHPELDVRAAALREPQGAGWYVQRARTFTPRGASTFLLEGTVVAARVEP